MKKLQNTDDRREKGPEKWKDIPWVGRLNIFKMSILASLIYVFNAIPIKILETYLDIKCWLLSLYQKEKAQNSQHNLKEIKVEGLTLPNFNTYYKPTLIKKVWYWWKNRHINIVKLSLTKE